MSTVTKEDRRRYERTSRDRRRERGFQRVEAELSPEAFARLEAMAKRHGSRTAAIEAAILSAAAQGEG